MPIYEYACNECGHTLDALQKVSEAPLTDCPECGEAALRRLISAPRFRLKGDGWYETDFKKDNQRNLAKSDSEPPKEKKEGKDKGDSGGKSTAKKKDDKKSVAAD
jgi:putative FmdB family regulatory protein